MQVRSTFLEKDEIEKLHEATLYVLEKVGVQFQHEDVLKLFKDHGAGVEGNNVYIDRSLLSKSLQSIPGPFSLYARNPENNILIGGPKQAYAPAYGPVFVRDGDLRRPALSSDFVNFTKLVESSEILGLANPNIIDCQDIPQTKRKMRQLALCHMYSSKPLIGITSGAADSQECIRMTKNFLGFADKPILLGVISPITPLKYDRSMLEAIIVYAENNQPLLISSCSMPGATSPATVASTLVVNNAEVLAGIVLSQLLSPGLPVIYGNTSVSCDLRYISPAIGSPETGLITFATAGLGQFYGIPSRSGGALTDSKLFDVQAGIESLLSMLPPIIAGIDFILHACGVIESFLTIDYDKFILDEEMIRMAMRLAQGFGVNSQTIGLEVIEEGGPGANFLSEVHTLKNFKREFYYPRLFSRENFELWEEKGALTIHEKARLEMNQRLSAVQELMITAEQKKILSDYL